MDSAEELATKAVAVEILTKPGFPWRATFINYRSFDDQGIRYTGVTHAALLQARLHLSLSLSASLSLQRGIAIDRPAIAT